ncbi:MAG: VacJ family lipoprotein [Campylobacterota bacterium]|nr:VacJ family lipoprotein [Campylobacterota bacterium]
MYKNIVQFFLTFFIIFVFIGCSSKSVDEPSQKNKIVEEQTQEDEFLDEFSDELEIEEVYDPLSGYNRIMTNFNDTLYINVLNPVAKGYKFVVPEGARQSVKNFFHNIWYPIRVVNNLLQGKLTNSAEETGRFVINSTIGILGLFDPAKSYFGLEAHDEDFGQTLGYWGVGSGFHIVLPILGPSNLRDTFSLYPDSLVDPVDYYRNRGYNLSGNYIDSLSLKAVEKVNFVSLHEGEYEKLKGDAIDLYPYLRDVYEQYRDEKIKE